MHLLPLAMVIGQGRGMRNITHTIDWDDIFANMAHIPGSEGLPAIWAERALAYRAATPGIEKDIPYGDHPRENFDLVFPDGTPKGLVVFVHGGYWMQLDKSCWTDLAEGARANGWAVCLPSYTLAPEARISHMTMQIAAAIDVAAGAIAGPVRISGHSAGGHLVSRMICDDTPLSKATLNRLELCLSISGLHDLRPLLKTTMNDTLHLDMEEATRESAILHSPFAGVPFHAWTGGGERPEFIRQAKLLDNIWSGLGMQSTCTIDGKHHHFSVIDGLKSPDSKITQELTFEATAPTGN